MSFLRGIYGSGRVGAGGITQKAATHEEERRLSRSGLVGTGTLACNRCDAPIAIGPSPVLPTDTLACPFCDHRAAARDFLSLASPARPARIEVRVRAKGRSFA